MEPTRPEALSLSPESPTVSQARQACAKDPSLARRDTVGRYPLSDLGNAVRWATLGRTLLAAALETRRAGW